MSLKRRQRSRKTKGGTSALARALFESEKASMNLRSRHVMSKGGKSVKLPKSPEPRPPSKLKLFIQKENATILRSRRVSPFPTEEEVDEKKLEMWNAILRSIDKIRHKRMTQVDRHHAMYASDMMRKFCDSFYPTALSRSPVCPPMRSRAEARVLNGLCDGCHLARQIFMQNAAFDKKLDHMRYQMCESCAEAEVGELSALITRLDAAAENSREWFSKLERWLAFLNKNKTIADLVRTNERDLSIAQSA